MAKYIVLSDVHLGQRHTDKIAGGQYCLLSEIPTICPEAYQRSAQTRAALRERLLTFAAGEAVTMVVVGDLLDLSMASMRESLADLIALLRVLPEVKDLVHVIGNHDHHMWSMHSEWERSFAPMQGGELPAPGGVYRSTNKNGERHHLLSELCQKQLGHAFEVRLAYPTFAFDQDPVGPGQGALFYFTHGHLFGGMYTACSDILEHYLANRGLDPEQVAATVNGPLIEFIYWCLSQAGEGMGADGVMEQIYADIQRGNDSEVEHLVTHAIELLIPGGFVPLVPDRLEHTVLVNAAMHMLKNSQGREAGTRSQERHDASHVTRRRLQRWAERSMLVTGRETHIIYGHTHVADSWTIPGTVVHTYNMGSWLVEPGHDHPDTRLMLIDTVTRQSSYAAL